jgi:hypothetical protein
LTKSTPKTRELRKTRENPVAGIVHGHRFLAVRALYFQDIGGRRAGISPGCSAGL